MKFTYAYKSSDNVRHTDVIAASSKEDAYSLLKARGIKPIRVDVAPGVINKLLSMGKRGVAICVLAPLCIVLASLAIIYSHGLSQRVESSTGAKVRCQIYGDPALMEELERKEYRGVFSTEADRYLAMFAQPGATVRFHDSRWRSEMANALRAGFTNDVSIVSSEEREIRELKQIVKGMREEYTRYMANGLGTPEKYIRRLEERQTREIVILTTAKRDLKDERDPLKWERINRSLKAIGLPTLMMRQDDE